MNCLLYYILSLHIIIHSLGFKPMTLLLLSSCYTIWATGMLYLLILYDWNKPKFFFTDILPLMQQVSDLLLENRNSAICELNHSNWFCELDEVIQSGDLTQKNDSFRNRCSFNELSWIHQWDYQLSVSHHRASYLMNHMSHFYDTFLCFYAHFQAWWKEHEYSPSGCSKPLRLFLNTNKDFFYILSSFICPSSESNKHTTCVILKTNHLLFTFICE